MDFRMSFQLQCCFPLVFAGRSMLPLIRVVMEVFQDHCLYFNFVHDSCNCLSSVTFDADYLPAVLTYTVL